MPIIVHLADVHIGISFESLPKDIGMQCRKMQMEALAGAVEIANSLTAAGILIAGDLFDTPDTPLALFSRTMEILSRAHCPVLISPGNHDYLHPHGPYCTAILPENVHVFNDTRLEPFSLDAHTVVWGAAFCDMSAKIPLDAILDAEKCNILCVHAEINVDNSYNAIRPEMLRRSGFDYAAFGHNHEYSGILCAGETTYACTGCLVGRGLSEPGARGYLLGMVEKGENELYFQPSSGVRFETIVQDITGLSDDRALGRAIAVRIPADHKNLVLVLELIGVRSYEPELRGLHTALSKICLFVILRDRTTVKQDPWHYIEYDDLRGIITRNIKEQYNASENEDEQQRKLLALQLSLAALDGAEFATV